MGLLRNEQVSPAPIRVRYPFQMDHVVKVIDRVRRKAGIQSRIWWRWGDPLREYRRPLKEQSE